MKAFEFIKTIYRGSLLSKCGAKISDALENSVLFSKEKSSNGISKGKILPALNRWASDLVCISCRDFALLLFFFLISSAISTIIDSNFFNGIVFLCAAIVLLPLFFVKYTFYSTHLLISCGIYGKERVEYHLIRQMKQIQI